MFHKLEKTFSIDGFYTFFEYTYPQDYRYEGEHHQFWEIVYCLNGSVGVSADDKIFRLYPGDLMIHKPMVYHRFWAEDDTQPQVMVFSFDISGDLPQNVTGGFSCDEYLREQLEAIYKRIRNSNCKRSLTGFLHYLDKNVTEYQLIANLCENCLINLTDHGLPLGANNSKQAIAYQKIIHVMKTNISGNLSTEEIGELCQMSVSTMKALFRAYNSMGIHEYYLYLKIAESIKLLRSGHTVTETANLLGFSSQSYFSTVFKRRTGEAPGKYYRH